VPHHRLGLVLLNNLHNSTMNQAVSNSLLDLLLDLPRRDWNAYLQEQLQKEGAAAAVRARERETSRHAGTKPSRELAVYAGRYENRAYGTAVVSLADDGLVWKWNAFGGRLEHFQYDTFTLDEDLLARPPVLFTLGQDGEVATMKVLGAMDVEFTKAGPKPSG
jgi:hypothetical protein